MTDAPHLRSCPFCLRKPVWLRGPQEAVCTTMGCAMEYLSAPLEKWNTRAPVQITDDMVARAADCLDLSGEFDAYAAGLGGREYLENLARNVLLEALGAGAVHDNFPRERVRQKP